MSRPPTSLGRRMAPGRPLVSISLDQRAPLMLGLPPEARENRLSLIDPVLPPWLDWIEVRDLRILDSSLDFVVSRGSQGAAVEILGRRGDAEIVVRR